MKRGMQKEGEYRRFGMRGKDASFGKKDMKGEINVRNVRKEWERDG